MDYGLASRRFGQRNRKRNKEKGEHPEHKHPNGGWPNTGHGLKHSICLSLAEGANLFATHLCIRLTLPSGGYHRSPGRRLGRSIARHRSPSLAIARHRWSGGGCGHLGEGLLLFGGGGLGGGGPQWRLGFALGERCCPGVSSGCLAASGWFLAV